MEIYEISEERVKGLLDDLVGKTFKVEEYISGICIEFEGKLKNYHVCRDKTGYFTVLQFLTNDDIEENICSLNFRDISKLHENGRLISKTDSYYKIFIEVVK